jgi:NACalpha-BTF3-like transcription factor
MPVRSILAEVDRDQIIKALAESGGRIGGGNGAAARLGLKRTTLITRMKKLGIDRNQTLQVDGVTVDTTDTDFGNCRAFARDETSCRRFPKRFAA